MKNLVLLVVLIVTSIFLWILIFKNSKSRNKKVKEYFAQLAEKYGLALDESNKIGAITYPLVTGIYKRRQIGIGCLAGGDKNLKEAKTYVRVECSNRHNMSFHLVRKAKNSAIIPDGRAVKMMDSEFDEKYIVASASPDLIFPVFTFNVKYSLLQAIHLGLKGELTLDKNVLDYTEPTLINDENSKTRIELLMHILCDVADELEKN